ncbi:hypothetical protein D3C72_952970 [compost metagenome]
MDHIFSAIQYLNGSPAVVWQVITNPVHMLQWTGDETMNLTIDTNWIPGTEIIITGNHHQPFENKGIVLQCIPEQQLSYTHLSSLSRLPDEPDNYTRIDFHLVPNGAQTKLELTISNFPTESIQKHLEFYWRTTMVKIKKYAARSL